MIRSTTPTFDAVWACARVLLRGELLHGEGLRDGRFVRVTVGGGSALLRDAESGRVLGAEVDLDAFELARVYVSVVGPARTTRSARVRQAARPRGVFWKRPR